jgi:hypothetical protein
MDNDAKGWGGFTEDEERRINEQLRTGLPKEFVKVWPSSLPCILFFIYIPNSSVFIFNRNEWAQVDKSLIMWKEEFNWKLQIMWVIL